MSEKGIYKKLVDKWFDDDKSQQRARENEFYEKSESGKVGRKSKAKPKDNLRADHKHDYIPVIVWGKSWNGKIYGSVGRRCSICGKKDVLGKSQVCIKFINSLDKIPMWV